MSKTSSCRDKDFQVFNKSKMFVYLVTILLVSGVSALPVVTDPCGGSNPVPGTSGQQPGTLGLAAVGAMAIEARVYTTILVDKYTNPEDIHIRISQSTSNQLEGSRLENYPKERKEYENTVEEKKLKIQNDYDNISIIAIFVHEVHADEAKSNLINHFKKEMLDFKTAINQLLCKVNMAAATEGFEITKNIREDVMLDKYRNMKINAFRYMRDYLVFRDARAFLTNMSHDYI